jgi:hypothetical protein
MPFGRRYTQPNDTLHNDTQHNDANQHYIHRKLYFQKESQNVKTISSNVSNLISAQLTIKLIKRTLFH